MSDYVRSQLTRREFLKLTAMGAATAGIIGVAPSSMSKGDQTIPDSPAILTNDTADLTPKASWDGPALEFDLPGLHIGVAKYEEGPTGCTVFYFPERAQVAADIFRGMQCTIYSDYLENGRTDTLDAICLAGGSIYGLEAATGVTAELLARDVAGGHSGWIRKTTGAIIYDLWRDNMIYPDKALGRAALRSARPGVFPLGRQGVGRSVGCGGAGKAFGMEPEWAGQGGAFRQVGSTRTAVFTAVNAAGAIVDRQGHVVRGHRHPETGKRYHYRELLEQGLTQPGPTEPPPAGNCTLTVVVTNQKVDRLDEIARHVHTSLARAIQPFHTPGDGDIVYVATTEQVENGTLNDGALSVLASELAWDAVLSGFQEDAADG